MQTQNESKEARVQSFPTLHEEQMAVAGKLEEEEPKALHITDENPDAAKMAKEKENAAKNEEEKSKEAKIAKEKTKEEISEEEKPKTEIIAEDKSKAGRIVEENATASWQRKHEETITEIRALRNTIDEMRKQKEAADAILETLKNEQKNYMAMQEALSSSHIFLQKEMLSIVPTIQERLDEDRRRRAQELADQRLRIRLLEQKLEVDENFNNKVIYKSTFVFFSKFIRKN